MFTPQLLIRSFHRKPTLQFSIDQKPISIPISCVARITAAGHFFNHFGTKVTFMYVSCFTCHIYTPSQLRAMIPRGLLMIISIHCIYLPPLLSCYPLKHEKALKIASYHCHARTIVHSVTAFNRTSTGGMSDKIKANHRNRIDKWACSIILNSLFYWFSIGKQNIHIYIYVHPHCITY